MRSCILTSEKFTFGLYLFDLFEERLVLAVDLQVADLLESYLLGPVVKEVELLRAVLANAALEVVELGFVDFPGSFHVLVEAKLVAHRYCSKHIPSKIYNRSKTSHRSFL